MATMRDGDGRALVPISGEGIPVTLIGSPVEPKARSADKRADALRGLVLGGCFALLFGVVAAPLVERGPREDARVAGIVRPSETVRAVSPAAPGTDALLLSEQVYQLLAREETALAPRDPAPMPRDALVAPHDVGVVPRDPAVAPRDAAPAAREAPSVQPVARATDAAPPVAEAIRHPAEPEATIRRASTSDKPAQATPVPRPADAFVGVWATHASACSPAANRRSYLLAAIDNDGAWAGETFCAFQHKQQTADGWSFVARCKSPRERWTANVRLKMDGARLTWASQRGTQAYVRCERRLITAQAS